MEVNNLSSARCCAFMHSQTAHRFICPMVKPRPPIRSLISATRAVINAVRRNWNKWWLMEGNGRLVIVNWVQQALELVHEAHWVTRRRQGAIRTASFIGRIWTLMRSWRQMRLFCNSWAIQRMSTILRKIIETNRKEWILISMISNKLQHVPDRRTSGGRMQVATGLARRTLRTYESSPLAWNFWISSRDRCKAKKSWSQL